MIKMNQWKALPLYAPSCSPQFSPPESSSSYSTDDTVHTANKHAISNGKSSSYIL